MKFKCNSVDFINALQISTHALPARTTMQILEYVLLETDDNDDLRIICSDGTLTMITKCAVTVGEGGSCLLPGKLLADMARRLPEGEMDFSTSGTTNVIIKCLGSRTSIAYRATNLYPRPVEICDVTCEQEITLPQPLFKDMIFKTSFAIAQDEERPILTGCLLEVQDGEARMVALDGFRMAVRMQRVSPNEKMYAVIPGKALQEIGRLLSDDEESMIKIAVAGGHMYTELGSTSVIATLKEGKYINYRMIIPNEWRTQADVDSGLLTDCVERASLMAREGKNNLVKLEIGDGMIVITSNSEIGDVHEEIEADIEGEGLKIAFNVKYLLDALKAMEGRSVRMQFNTGITPCVVIPADSDEFTHLILPVRMQS